MQYAFSLKSNLYNHHTMEISIFYMSNQINIHLVIDYKE